MFLSLPSLSISFLFPPSLSDTYTPFPIMGIQVHADTPRLYVRAGSLNPGPSVIFYSPISLLSYAHFLRYSLISFMFDKREKMILFALEKDIIPSLLENN